ncbi:MAG: hypothetical protein ABI890_08590, partial [Lapillicoccus sp.]
AVSAYSGQVESSLALAFAGVVLAWGWPVLLGSPSPTWSGVVVGLGAVSIPATAGLTPDADQLRWLPVALGAALILGFLQQLLRRDRTRLTEGIATTVAGLAIATSGAPLAVVPAYRDGADFVLAAMAALVLAALVEQLSRIGSVQRWVLLPVLVAGAVGGLAVAQLTDSRLTVLSGVLVGLGVALVSHVLRRVLSVLPTARALPSALASGAASLLSVGVVVYLATRVVVG